MQKLKKLIKFPRKVKGELKSKTSSGAGSYHAAHAVRHLENNCNEACRASIEKCTIERNNRREKCEDEVTIKTEQCQEEAACAESKHKRG